MKKIPLLIIAGPTAAGKSAVAVALAQALKGEVVSADSMQVYRYMDIGTAKVDAATRALVPHHMLDVVDPWQDYSLALYKEQAEEVCRQIHARGRLPIVAGGTGLYIRALAENFPLDQLPHDPQCRLKLEEEWQQRGQQFMRQRLEQVDPDLARRIAVNDRRRTIRALEIWELTGRAPSAIHRQARDNSPFSPLIFALTLPRPQLYAKIDARAEEMVKQGLVGEYINLLALGAPMDCNAMQGLGYRHCGLYVKGIWSLPEMVENLKRDTRRYAKRQLTWFRAMDCTWLDNGEPSQSITRITQQVAGKWGLAAK